MTGSASTVKCYKQGNEHGPTEITIFKGRHVYPEYVAGLPCIFASSLHFSQLNYKCKRE